MPQLGEVVHGRPDAGGVVEHDAREGRGPVGPADQDGGDAEPLQQADAAVVVAQVVEEHPVDPAVGGQGAVRAFLGGLVPDHAEDQDPALLGEHRLDAGHEGGVEGVRGDDPQVAAQDEPEAYVCEVERVRAGRLGRQPSSSATPARGRASPPPRRGGR